MLASASDDGTVRIWSTEEQVKLQQECQRVQELNRKMTEENRKVEEEATRTEGVSQCEAMRYLNEVTSLNGVSESYTAFRRVCTCTCPV